MALKLRDSPLHHLSVANLYHAFDGLAEREKIFALVGIGVALLLLLFLPFSLVSGKIGSMQKTLVQMQEGTREVAAKIGEYRRVTKEIEALEAKMGRGGSLTSRVEGIGRKVGMTFGQLKEKPPQETDFFEINAVEVRMQGTTLKQLTDFLSEVEGAGLVGDPNNLMRLRRIQIKPKYGNRDLLDVSCEIATFAVKREA